MAVTLKITERQAKALTWLVGSVSARINDDLDLDRLYSALYDAFGYVQVDGVERDEACCWSRKSALIPAKISGDASEITIDVS